MTEEDAHEATGDDVDAPTEEDADETDPAHDHDSAADVGLDVDEGRTTAPMSAFTTREAVIGFLVLAVGVALAFAIPILATL